MSVILTEELSYQEQLETKEWKSRRKEIIERDNHHCLFCGKGKSIQITFNNSVYHLGIDYAMPIIAPTNYSIVESGAKLSDEIKKWNNRRIKRGPLPLSKQIGILSADGYFFYTVWTKDENYKGIDIKAEACIAKLLCNDGYIAYVLYTNEQELENLELYRVYIQKEALTLSVHHKRYMIGNYAWEYEDDDLVTLCQSCHSKVHEFLPVQTYAKVNGHLKVMNYTPCVRCNGTGYLPEYNHVENGICFRCRGARFEELIPDQLKSFEVF